MKSPLIIVTLILPAIALAACKPALIPPLEQGNLQAVPEAEWKRGPAAMSSSADGPATGISLERAGQLNAPARTPVRYVEPVEASYLPDGPNAADVDHSRQNRSLQARRGLALQLLQALSVARP